MLQITFANHTIPDPSLSAIASDRIFYYSDGYIFSYEISTSKHTRISNSERPTSLFTASDSKLLIVSGNTVKILDYSNFSSESVKLKEIPIRSAIYNGSNFTGTSFIYKDSFEILSVNKHIKPSLIHIILPVKDMCFCDEFTFIITNENRIARMRNIFLTREILGLSSMHIYPSTDKVYSRIFIQESNMFVKTETLLEKYEIGDQVLNLEYSLAIESNCSFSKGYLLSSSFIQLSKAPFLVLKDRLFYFDGKLGISVNRIYSFKDVLEPNKNKIAYSTPSFRQTTINPNTIKVPAIFKDEKQKEDFLKNELKIRKYEILLEKMNEINADIDRKETEVSNFYQDLKHQMDILEEKANIIKEKVRDLRKRAENIKFKGSKEEFYRKIDLLKMNLDSLPGSKELNEFKNTLKAQKATLSNKSI